MKRRRDGTSEFAGWQRRYSPSPVWQKLGVKTNSDSAKKGRHRDVKAVGAPSDVRSGQQLSKVANRIDRGDHGSRGANPSMKESAIAIRKTVRKKYAIASAGAKLRRIGPVRCGGVYAPLLEIHVANCRRCP